MKKKIAVVAGGTSSESVVSLLSAEQIMLHLDKDVYDVYQININKDSWELQDENSCGIPVNKNNFTVTKGGQTLKFDCVFVAIHGTPGEDGKLQGYFDMLHIPYTTGNVLSMSLSFGKYFCNTYLKAQGIKAAPSVLITRNTKVDTSEILKTLKLPVFVKPNDAGSSFGVSKVKAEADLALAIENARKESDLVVVEQGIEGTEITAGVFKNSERTILFPVTEIVSKNEFFDYEAKYKGLVDEITPARISVEATQMAQQTASHIYDLLQCRGVVRVDFILSNNELYFLEINTVPGMTRESIIPQQAKVLGLPLSQLYSMMIEDAIARG